MTNQRPTKEIKLGSVRAAIWRNELESGRVRHSVTFSRLYKDKEEGAWRDATSFGSGELPLLGRVAEQALAWIYQQGTERPPAAEEHAQRSPFAMEE